MSRLKLTSRPQLPAFFYALFATTHVGRAISLFYTKFTVLSEIVVPSRAGRSAAGHPTDVRSEFLSSASSKITEIPARGRFLSFRSSFFHLLPLFGNRLVSVVAVSQGLGFR